MLWTRDESKERFPEALSPLGWSVLQSALEVNLESIRREFYLKKLDKNQVTRWIDGYLYSGKDFFKRIPIYHFSLVALVGLCLKALIYSIPAFFNITPKENFKTRWLKLVYQKLLKPKIQKTIYDWQNELPKHLKNFDDNTLSALTWQATHPEFKTLMKKIESDGCAYNRLDFAIYFYKNLLKTLLELVSRWKNESISVEHLTSLSAFQISHHINHLISEGSLLVDETHVFSFVSQRIGHLSLSWDIAQPTFGEKTDLIKKMILDKRGHSPVSLLNKTKPNDEIAEQFIQLVACDEQHRFYASYQFPTVRTLLYKIADEWVKHSILSDRDDLFYLTLDEVFQYHSQLLETKTTEVSAIRNKIQLRKSFIKAQVLEELTDQDVEHRESIFYTSKSQNAVVNVSAEVALTGIAASKGVARGLAFWVTDYTTLENTPDHCILLCQTPSPNFHSAFVKAAAVVSESGGLLSHGAIIARELQIPCLLQVVNLKTIKNGDQIEVDAHNGIIKRLS